MSKKDIIFNLPSKNSNNRFLNPDNGIEYVRTFGLWKCVKCHKRWHSAHTWISLKFVKNNKELYKSKEKLSSGSAFKFLGPDENIHSQPSEMGWKSENKDILQQHCKACNSKNNKVINYSELLKGLGNKELPHRAKLCAKCLSGYPCKNYS